MFHVKHRQDSASGGLEGVWKGAGDDLDGAAGWLRDDVRQQCVFDNRDLVPQPQLALFQASNLELVS